MAYTDEEIEQHLEILNNYTANQEVGDEDGDRHFRCWNCESDRFFFVESGYNKCEECGTSNGHALGFFDLKEYDRFHYRRKNTYQRKYHYEKKVNQIYKRLSLTDEDASCLFNKLMEIDQDTISEL